MDEMKNTYAPKRHRWIYPFRAITIFVIFMILRTVTAIRIYALGYDDPSGMDLPAQVPYILVLITNIFILNSILHVFTTYDHPAANRYKEICEREVRFLPEIKRILRSYEFISETTVLTILTVIFSLMGFLSEGYGCFYGSYSAPQVHRALLPLIFFIPTVFFVSLFSRYEARRYWCQLINLRNYDKLDEKLPLIIRALAIVILYPLVFPYAPFVVFMFITVLAVLAKVAKVLSVLGVILVVAIIFFLSVGISRLKFGKKKKEFILSLSRIANEADRRIDVYTKSEAAEKKYDLSYYDGDDRYDVKLIYARKGVPLFFTKPNDAYFRHRIGTKNHHYTLERHFDYSFESEGKKALIIIKFPKNVFVASDGGSRRMGGGDKIWDTVVYDSQTFLGSAERSCLERFNTGKW